MIRGLPRLHRWGRAGRSPLTGGTAGATPFEGQARNEEGAMSYAKQMLSIYPSELTADANALAVTIDALNDCSEACTADTDADLGESSLLELVKCIRLCQDCVDVCVATVSVISRRT